MLGIPNYAFNFSVDNWFTGTPNATPGTQLGDPGATPHTKSATTALIGTGIAHNGYWVKIDIYNTALAATDTSALLDIMYDPAGGTSWNVLIPDLLCGFRITAAVTASPGATYSFPLYIPKGSSIGARWQSSIVSPAAAQRPRVCIQIMGGPSKPGFWYGTKVTACGVNAAASAGVDLNPGSTGAYSGWVSVGGTTNPKFGYLQMGVQGSAGTHTADNYFIQYGHGSTQLPGANIRVAYTTGEVIVDYPQHAGIFTDVPAGTQLQARATGSDATSEDPSVIIYGVS
jgi:hypothetical protein